MSDRPGRVCSSCGLTLSGAPGVLCLTREGHAKGRVQTPTREELLSLCERGVVPEKKWWDRDSASAQRQLGECRALLAAGCDFDVEPEIKHNAWWVHVFFRGFDAFEYGEQAMSHESFYVPTSERLEARPDGDWY